MSSKSLQNATSARGVFEAALQGYVNHAALQAEAEAMRAAHLAELSSWVGGSIRRALRGFAENVARSSGAAHPL